MDLIGGHSITGHTSTGGTIPRTAQSSYDILAKTTVYALCVAIVFVLLAGVGSADNNTAPVLDPIGDRSVDENTELSFTVSAADDDGDTLTYSAIGLPTGANLDSSSGLFTWTPTYDQEGTHSVQFNVTDETTFDSETIDITVNGVNRPPILDPIGNKNINENTILSFTVSASDEDVEDTLTYSAVGLPTGASLDHSSGLFEWTPTYDQEGTYSVQFKVTDGTDTDSETVTITVNGENRPPVLNPIGDRSVDENTELSFAVSASDDDGDALTYSAIGLPAGANLDSSSGVFTWTPTYDQEGTHSVQFNVTDGTTFDSETVDITVNGVNRPPILDPIGNKNINENTELSFTVSASDDDADTLTYSAVGLPTGASLDHSNGLFEWTPTYDQEGTYSVQFKVTDGTDTDSETVTITVNGVNRPPILDPIGDRSVDENTELSFTLNASDDDADTLTYSAIDLPTGATLISSSGVFTWTPTYDQAGTHSVQFKVTDGTNSDSETVILTVNGVNRPPILDPIGNKNINENTELSFSVSAADDDADTLTYSAVGLPTGASLDHSSGLFEWTPTYDQEGTYSIQFKVTDGTDTDSETVTITVNGVNRPPVLNPIGDRSVDENTELSFAVSASDDDADTLTYSAIGLPTGASLDHSNGLFEWTPTYDQEGTYSVQFKVTDGTDTDSETVTITVNGENRPPILDPIGDRSVDENTELSFTVSAADDDGNTLTYSAVGRPTGATLISSTGLFKWTPTYEQAGEYSIQFKVTDGTDSDSETVIITVNGVNRAPALDLIGQKSVNENTTLSFTVSASDEDDEDTLTYSAIDLPTGATLNSSNGLFAWTPTYEQAGTYHVKFEVTDGLLEDSENVTITVNDVNRAPILDPITGIQINETETATIVLGASDPDDDTIAYSTNATFGVLTNNTFTWTSGYDDYGIYYLEFTVSDGNLVDTEIGIIVVGDADRAPILDHIGPRTVNENSILSFTLNASDADGDTLTYSAIGLPTGATLNSSNGLFKWIPDYTQAGTYHVKFEVTDGLLQDSENVTITVNDVNTAVTPPSSGGGGGGGGGSTGEEFDNIEVRDVIRVYINKGSNITYEFKEEINAIDFVRFDAKTSAGYIAATIEVLKDTSALVSTPPSGEVYQNMNIWVGNAGYATEDKISNPSIEFKVARTWIAENNINQYKIQLCRYSSGVWNPLPTTKKYEDVKYIYFTSKTSGFSSFAITGIKSSNFMANTMALNMPEKDTPTTYFSTPSTPTDDTINSDEVKSEIDVPHEEAKSSRGLIFILSSIGIVAIIIFMYRRRDSSWDMP